MEIYFSSPINKVLLDKHKIEGPVPIEIGTKVNRPIDTVNSQKCGAVTVAGILLPCTEGIS